MARTWILFFGLLVSVFWALEASAQSTRPNLAMCGPNEQVFANIEQKLNEVPVSGGVTENGNLLQILLSKSGEWSVFVTFPTGLSCLVALGNAWKDIVPEIKSQSDGR